MSVVSCRICVDGMAANNITGLHTSVVVLRKYACRTHLRACSPSQTPRDHIYTIYTCTVAPSLRETDLSMVTRRKCWQPRLQTQVPSFYQSLSRSTARYTIDSEKRDDWCHPRRCGQDVFGYIQRTVCHASLPSLESCGTAGIL
jgi:hypothetical protein